MLKFIYILLFSLLSLSVYSQCTDNETCATAQGLTLTSITADSSEVCFTDCNTGASDQMHVLLGGCPTLTVRSEVWYSVTIPAGHHTMDVSAISAAMPDMIIGIWVNCGTITTCLYEGSGGTLDIEYLSVIPGNTYYISIGSDDSAEEGNFDMCVTTYVRWGSDCSRAVQVNCGDTLYGETTAGNGNVINDWDCAPYLTSGLDRYYAVTWEDAVNGGTIRFTFLNVVDADDSYFEFMMLDTPCADTCEDHAQFVIADGAFNGSGSPAFGYYVPAGVATYYFVVDQQIGGQLDSYDLIIDCYMSGIELDTTNSCGASFDPTDVNNGIYTTWDGALAPNTFDASAGGTYTICENIYVKNTGWEWLKYFDIFLLGSCWTNVTNISHYDQNDGVILLTDGADLDDAQNSNGCGPGPQSKKNTGNWNAVSSVSNINWDFTYNVNCGSTLWGDGGSLGTNYTCGLYTFCFTADIDPLCTDPLGFQNLWLATDDGIGGGGSTAASSVIGLSSPTTNNTTTLPVEISQIHVDCDNMILKWTTVSETNNDYFEVQYSLNGKTFQVLGVVNGHGNSNTQIDYEYPIEKNGLYKLKQVDYNGQHSSELVIVDCKTNISKYKLQPNPIEKGAKLIITNISNSDVVTVFNMLGEEVNSTRLTSGMYVVLVNGIYLDKLIVK